MHTKIIQASEAFKVHPDAPKSLESNTQGEFYHQARLIGLPVLLELSTPVGRVDIAVLREDKSAIVAIVECKRNGRAVYGNSRQIQRYKRLGVPVYGLNDFSRAARLASTIFRRHLHQPGTTWATIKAMSKTPRTHRDPEWNDRRWSEPSRIHIAC